MVRHSISPVNGVYPERVDVRAGSDVIRVEVEFGVPTLTVLAIEAV